MTSRPEHELTQLQRVVRDAVYALHERNHRPVSIEEVSVETLLSPDAVVRAVTVLVEAGAVRVYEPAKDEAELQLEVAGATR